MFARFVEQPVKRGLMWSITPPLGSDDRHLISFLARRYSATILFMMYEIDRSSALASFSSAFYRPARRRASDPVVAPAVAPSNFLRIVWVMFCAARYRCAASLADLELLR